MSELQKMHSRWFLSILARPYRPVSIRGDWDESLHLLKGTRNHSGNKFKYFSNEKLALKCL